MALGDFFNTLASGAGSAGGVSAGFGGAGLALAAVGTVGSIVEGQKLAQTQSQEAQNSMQQFGVDEQMNNARQQQMTLSSQRQQMQNLRNLQRAKASGLAGAVSSGAQFGSGLAGAQAGETAQAGVNTLNTAQNQMIGNQMFGLMNRQDQLKIQMAGLQSTAATQQGTMSMFQGAGQAGERMFSGAMSFGKIFGAS
jgi:hypothetical protein